MVAWRYEISLLVLKKIFHSFAALTREIFFNTRREISYLRAAICYNRRSFYYKEQSTAKSNSFKIAQKTAFEVKRRLYTTGKVIQRLFIIDLYT